MSAKAKRGVKYWLIQFPPIFIRLWKVYNLSAVWKLSKKFDSRVSAGKISFVGLYPGAWELWGTEGSGEKGLGLPNRARFHRRMRARRKRRSALNPRRLHAVFIRSSRPGVSIKGSLGVP